MSCETIQEKDILVWLYIIDHSSILHELINNPQFSLSSLRNSLQSFRKGEFSNSRETFQDPLCSALDLCSYNQHKNIIIIILSSFSWNESIEVTMNRISLTSPDTNFSFIIVEEQEETCSLASHIASLRQTQVLQIQNTEEGMFQFFRNLIIDIFYPSHSKILHLGSHLIPCEIIPLFQKSSEISQKLLCKCHNLPVTQNQINYCSETKKKLSPNQMIPIPSLNGIPLDIFPEFDDISEVSHFKGLCHVEYSQVSSSITNGTAYAIRSGSGKFYRLLAELRLQREVLIAKKEPSNSLAGEYWVFCPDPTKALLIGKKLCNRLQILRLDIPPIEQEDVYIKPILDELPKDKKIFPFYLGKNDLLSTFSNSS